MKKLTIGLTILAVILAVFYYGWLVPRYTVPILMYHSIENKETGFSVTPENFLKQMKFIKDNGYEVISLNELVGSIKNKKRLERNKVVVTFDDGYKDNLVYAYPVLRKFNFPATIFLVTGYIGLPFKKGDEREFMNWNDVRLMSERGISFGGHTRTHYNLGLLNDDGLGFEEIAGSKKIIEEKTGKPADFFCYPGGAFNEKAKALVIKTGYKGACTTNRGFASPNSDVYELKRIKVTNSDTAVPFSFRAKLSGYYNVFRAERDPY
jgi:peptidoglycan/xylan/chitin deacetylase (PgdA/CDA1 family)